ncbi:MAG: hypothetical protein AAF492_07040, partial [Verrucomicrobiota bacterium]
TNLLPQTLSYFTFRATNCLDEVWGMPVGRVVADPPDAVQITNPANLPISAGAAAIRWNLQSGEPADVTMFWGDNSGGTDFADWDNAIHVGPQSLGEGQVVVTGLLYGLQYYYRAYGTNLVSEDWGNNPRQFKVPPPAGLELTNRAPTDVNVTSAVLTAEFNAPDSVWDIDVYYGTTDGGTTVGAWDHTASFGWVTNAGLFNPVAAVTNLVPATAYYVTWRATNCAEVIWSQPSLLFNAQSYVDNEPGAVQQIGAAMLQGNLIAGGPATVIIHWGDDDGGTNANAWDHAIRFENQSPGAIAAGVSGLTYGLPYYYRLQMTNSAGDNYWANETALFKTLDPSSPATGMAWLYSTELSSGTHVLNIDSSTNTLDWKSHKLDAASFSIDPANPHQVIVTNAGDYLVAFTLPMTNNNLSVNNQRTCIRAELYLNGVGMGMQGAIGESSYMRGHENAFSRHLASSDHFATLLTNVPAGAVIDVRLTSTAGASSDVVMQQASLWIEAVGPSRPVFAATTTDGGLTMVPNGERAVDWEDTARTSADFSHALGSSDIVLTDAGSYLVFVNMPYSSSNSRVSSRLQVKLDGVRVPGGLAQQGYIRVTGDHNDASVHWSGMVLAAGTGQVLTITAQRETTATGTAFVDNGRMSIYVEKIDTSSGAYFGRANSTTPFGGWNPPTTAHVSWGTDELIDTNVFAHQTGGPIQDEIVIQQPGDYLLVYNDALASSVERVNPAIGIDVNGVPVAGAETKTHFIRSSAGHNGSSASLVYLLHDLTAGSTVQVSVVQGHQGGTVNSSDDAILFLYRKGPGGNNYPVLRPFATNIPENAATMAVDFDGTGAAYDLTLFWGAVDHGTNAAAWTEEVPFGWQTNQVGTFSNTFSGFIPADQFYFTWRATNCDTVILQIA